jgi:hypothetical protein
MSDSRIYYETTNLPQRIEVSLEKFMSQAFFDIWSIYILSWRAEELGQGVELLKFDETVSVPTDAIAIRTAIAKFDELKEKYGAKS